MSGCADLATLGTPTSLENFGILASTLSFQKADNSGVKASGLSMWLVTPNTAQTVATKLQLLPHPDKSIDAFVNTHCGLPDPGTKRLQSAVASTLLLAWGQWAYNQVLSQLEGRIKQLKVASDPPPYAFKQAVAVPPTSRKIKDEKGNERTVWNVDADTFWKNITCIIVHRTTKGANPKPELPEGMTAIIRKEAKGSNASTFKLIYLRLDNSIAITAAGTGNEPPEVQVTVAFGLFGARNDKGKNVVEEMATLAFKPVSAPLGGTKSLAEVCTPGTRNDGDPSANYCKWESDLIPNPHALTTAMSVSVSVKETGSAADAADKATDSLKALNAIVKPSFDTWLKSAVAQATK